MGQIELHRLSSISASIVGGTQQHVRRRRRDIARDTDASFLVSIQMSARSLITQSGRQARLRPGDLALYSSTDPYSLNVPDDFSQMVVQIPREKLLARLPNADLLTGSRVDGRSEIARLARDSISQLIDAGDRLNGIALSCLQDAVIDLIAGGLASLDNAPVSLSEPEQLMLLRSRAHIEDHLADPELGRESLASAMGMSVRRLSEIFQKQGQPIATTIRDMRLQKIAAEMLDPRNRHRSIGELATKWGIYNLPQFSRAFRARFDMTPRDYRRMQFPI